MNKVSPSSLKPAIRSGECEPFALYYSTNVRMMMSDFGVIRVVLDKMEMLVREPVHDTIKNMLIDTVKDAYAHR